jgi:alkanesulfonate monooxygenase SsuD/methylene tetrahydromethanopterin reductase-like flavin-dependent oxidoreductase (luciferase family)
MKFGLAYDLRNPDISGRSTHVLYAECLAQVEWADRHGFDFLNFPEHHFSGDSYIPSPFTIAAAAAARTSRIQIVLNLVLLPLRHPVQVAEDGAVVDIISGGRFTLTVGAGYRPEEYAGLGIDMRERGRRMEEGVEIIKRCWTEDEFSFEGRIWKLQNVRVMPKPVQKPRPRIIMGGASPASARRAARIADEYNPIGDRLWGFYREEMVRLGKDPGPPPIPPDAPRPPSQLLHVARDPAAAWKIIGPHAMAHVNSYAAFAGDLRFGPYQAVSQPDELLERGTHRVVTPKDAVALGKEMEAAYPGRATLRFEPLVGGMPATAGQECLDLVVNEVMPHFRHG